MAAILKKNKILPLFEKIMCSLLHIVMKIIDIFLLKMSKNILIIIKKLDSSLITFSVLWVAKEDPVGTTEVRQRRNRRTGGLLPSQELLNPSLGNFLY